MTDENRLDASDKLNIIDNKINFLTNILFCVNTKKYSFDEKDMSGFGMILSDVQEELQEAIKLLK